MYAIWCSSGYLTIFGGGSTDIGIKENSIKDNSGSHLGCTYELPQGYNEE
jgi:hypothetical protein